MFYKVEQAGESIHAVLNDIHRKIWSIRDGEQKLWKFIERYELRNVLDVDIVAPVKRVFKNHKGLYHEDNEINFYCNIENNKVLKLIITIFSLFHCTTPGCSY